MKQEIKKKVIRRLKIIEGQIKGLQRMVDGEKYCIDIIHQSQAIKEALSSIETLMLENHLTTHAIHQIKNGEDAKAIKEILSVCHLSNKSK